MKRLSRLAALLLTLAMLLSLVSIAHAEEKQSATAWLLYFASNHETDSSKFPWWPQHKSADQPSSETGVEATNAEVTGPGMYTVGLKFNWQKAEGAIQFNLVLDNAESLFPGYYVKITDIRVNGKSIDHKPNLYGTFHDDPNAGFAPIYNNYWDKNFSPDSTGPDGLRAFDSADEATYEIINPDDIVAGDTIEVDFIVAANAGEMPEDIGEKPGKLTSLGAKDDSVGLPTATWSLTKFTVDDYNKLFQDIVDGKVAIDSTVVKAGDIADVQFSNLTVNYQ